MVSKAGRSSSLEVELALPATTSPLPVVVSPFPFSYFACLLAFWPALHISPSIKYWRNLVCNASQIQCSPASSSCFLHLWYIFWEQSLNNVFTSSLYAANHASQVWAILLNVPTEYIGPNFIFRQSVRKQYHSSIYPVLYFQAIGNPSTVEVIGHQ